MQGRVYYWQVHLGIYICEWQEQRRGKEASWAMYIE